MVTKTEYTNANLELENLIKRFDNGENVDKELNSVSNIIEEYEERYYPII